jgi:uncharacterized protein
METIPNLGTGGLAMRPVARLAELNAIDLVVDGLSARLAQIAEGLREPAALRAARTALTSAEATAAKCRAAQVSCEAAQSDAQTRLARTEQSLYSGKVQNPKELGGLERDQAQLRRQVAGCEDQLLEALLAVEAANVALVTCRQTLERLTAEWQTAQGKLRAERTRLAAQLLAEQSRQAAARQAAPAALLPLYDSLRARRGGRAVAEVQGQECAVCGVAVAPTKLEAALYGEELVYCDNCGRMLWGE